MWRCKNTHIILLFYIKRQSHAHTEHELIYTQCGRKYALLQKPEEGSKTLIILDCISSHLTEITLYVRTLAYSVSNDSNQV